MNWPMVHRNPVGGFGVFGEGPGGVVGVGVVRVGGTREAPGDGQPHHGDDGAQAEKVPVIADGRIS